MVAKLNDVMQSPPKRFTTIKPHNYTVPKL